MGKALQVFNKDSAVSVGVVIAMMTAVIWFTRLYTELTSTISHYKEQNQQLTDEVTELKTVLTQHMAEGVDGYPHPGGVISEIERLKTATEDRWKKNDDFIFMREFCNLNDLKMPKHLTIDQASCGDE